MSLTPVVAGYFCTNAFYLFIFLQVEYVKLLNRYPEKTSVLGTLYLTATHLIYVEQTNDTRNETWVLHHHITSVEKLPLSASGCPLLIRCKTFQLLHLLFQRERDCQDVYQSLLRLSQPVKEEELYAFLYNPHQNEEERRQGWEFINVANDFSRMGLSNEYWEISDLNKNYEICSTYPSVLGLPKNASVATAAICRCSQPLSGLTSRCVEDEQMLQAISQANPNCPFIYVVDTRPKLNAMANRAAGKGYENEDNYSNIRFQFQGIENIHVMRNSLQKLLEVCTMKSPSMSDYLTGLENSGWLRHIKSVMDAGVFLAKAVSEERASVLVHCSDGWDRTAQVCSLACILLDPYYRTIKGLMVMTQCGHLDTDPKEVSPVFTQFLECVWQLSEQFPSVFEFNERYLIEIHNQVYACQYGNFIGNCQKERLEMRLHEKTFSLWPHLLKNQELYRNPLFWCGMYNHYDRGMHPKQSVLDQLLSLTQKQVEGERTMTELQRQLAVADGVLSDPSGPINTPVEQDSPSAPVVQSNGSCAPLINGDAEEVGPGVKKCNEKEEAEPAAPEHDLTSSKDKTVSVETEHSKEEVQESS
ncbi:Myotubularin-related protein 8 [Labeo rohita]|uniref:Myotubularin-related protein 8 n=1 Tax=Labeo rohita TaxID=84645 RepID=A0ABQ8MR15_LABRO|nr:Myotubularin-related protein 8 [Labeo rohita]